MFDKTQAYYSKQMFGCKQEILCFFVLSYKTDNAEIKSKSLVFFVSVE